MGQVDAACSRALWYVPAGLGLLAFLFSKFCVNHARCLTPPRQYTSHFCAAVKCNNDIQILRTLAASDVNFDCASSAEFSAVLSLGVHPDRIVFAHPCKFPQHLRAAAEMGVNKMTADSEEELVKIAKYHTAAQVLLRLKVPDGYASTSFGGKFGVAPTAVEYVLTRAAELGVNVIGVSYHVGTDCDHVGTFAEAVRIAHEAMDLGRKAGHEMYMLDIGGGFPGDPPRGEPAHAMPRSFPDIAAGINAALDMYFPEGSTCALSGKPINIVAEPGRYFVSSCATLATPVVAVRRNGNPVGDGMTRLYVDDGVYGSFNCMVFDHKNPLPTVVRNWRLEAHRSGKTASESQPAKYAKSGDDAADEQAPDATVAFLSGALPIVMDPRAHTAKQHKIAMSAEDDEGAAADAEVSDDDETWERVSIWGPTCDSVDCIVKELFLLRSDATTAALTTGDWLLWDAMGAYTGVAASNFNGMPGPRKMYVLGDHEVPVPQSHLQRAAAAHESAGVPIHA